MKKFPSSWSILSTMRSSFSSSLTKKIRLWAKFSRIACSGRLPIAVAKSWLPFSVSKIFLSTQRNLIDWKRCTSHLLVLFATALSKWWARLWSCSSSSQAQKWRFCQSKKSRSFSSSAISSSGSRRFQRCMSSFPPSSKMKTTNYVI